MNHDLADPLQPEAELALAWTPPDLRSALATAFALDRRLARIVARTSEPMLGQMRLAWWRDALAKPAAARPRGDAVLDAIGRDWQGREPALAALVDGWEVLVTSDKLTLAEAEAFGSQRGAFFAALGASADTTAQARIRQAGMRWAVADAAAAVSDPDERALLIEVGLASAAVVGQLPQAMRGLAVLDGLALRALRRGGRPLMEGRSAPVTALRAAIFRR